MVARFYSEGHYHLEARNRNKEKEKKKMCVSISNISEARWRSNRVSSIISIAEKVVQMLKTQLSNIMTYGNHSSWLLHSIFWDNSIVTQHGGSHTCFPSGPTLPYDKAPKSLIPH